MTKSIYGGKRTKSARENYIERLSYGQGLSTYTDKKRKTFTHLSTLSNNEFAYQSTSDYLRQVAEPTSIESTEMLLARNIPRTKSASELTPRNNPNRSTNGNPKYKAQEDYYDDIQALKKEMKATRDENSNLRAKIRRVEEDNARKRKEIDTLYDTSKDGDLRRTLSGSTTDRTNNNNTPVANVVLSLKQRVFKLELQLKQKETTIDEMKSDPRWTKSSELEIQNRALFGELQRQKVERSNNIQQNDYTATIGEEIKNAVRKLDSDKKALKEENESLMRKVRELEKLERSEPLSTRHPDDNKHNESFKQMEDLRQQCKNYRNEIDQMKDNLEQSQGQRDEFREKFNQANKEAEAIKRDRDQYHQKFDRANEDLENLRRESDRQVKPMQTGRSSPALKRDEEPHRDSMNLSSTDPKRSQSPPVQKRTPPASTNVLRRDSGSSEEPNINDSKLSAGSHTSATKLGRHTPPLSTNVLNSSFNAKQTKPAETASPRLSSKIDNLGSGTMKSQPPLANTSNESSLKTIQASLRGYLNRSEMDQPRKQTSSLASRPQTTPAMKKFQLIESDDDDIVVTPSKPSGSANKLDGLRDKIKLNSSDNDLSKPKQSLSNDKIGSNSPLPSDKRDSAAKIRRSPSPTPSDHRPSSPLSSSKPTLPNERNKLGSGSRVPPNDQKPRQAPSPTPGDHRPSSPLSGPKPTLANERNKLGSGSRVPTTDQKPRQSSSPTPTDQRPLSPLPGAKTKLLSDRSKLGSGTRELSSNAQRPLSPSNDRGPISAANSLPSSRKNSTSSKQSVKVTQNNNDDDDDDVI